MTNPGAPSRLERLQGIAATLHLVYSEGPLTKSDAFAAQMRSLYELERGSDRKALPNVKQMCAGIKPDHAIEHIVVCPACGQMFDCRDHVQVDYHSTDHHAPSLH